jgi:reactive intermediate/imine deaminase
LRYNKIKIVIVLSINLRNFMESVIQTNKAPAAIGTYCQARKFQQTVFLSGQIPLNPTTNALVEGDFRDQVIQVFENLKAVCEAAGGSLASLVRIGVYLTDLQNFSVLNEVMSEYFVAPYPARSTIEVSGLPKGALVEVDGIAVL